ncbi:hypothetical protein [Methylobacterium sp. A52T]
MDYEFHGTDVQCKNGVAFSVHAPGPTVTIVTAPDDAITASSALAPYRRDGHAADGYAHYTGMPVEAVRAYCVTHGGVARIGRTAQSLLQALPTEADLAAARAVAAEAPATDSPTRPSRTKALMDAGTHDFLGRPLPPGLPVDHLTPVVIEARRVVSEVERPLRPVLGYGDVSARQAALEWRVEQASSAANRLALLEGAQYVRHPLRAEAIALRKRLAKAEAQALAEIAREA